MLLGAGLGLDTDSMVCSVGIYVCEYICDAFEILISGVDCSRPMYGLGVLRTGAIAATLGRAYSSMTTDINTIVQNIRITPMRIHGNQC